ncbi:MAG: ABC transporter permease [Actinomycetota bacterium]|nr:ABC transporter permease [Actinomycetota bacterium]
MSVVTPEAPFEPEGGERLGAGLRRYLTMPASLVAVCVALYLWVSAQDLDSIEQRRLNAGQIGDAFVGHMQLTALSTIAVLLIAVPLGVLLTRSWARGFAPPIIAVANVGQAVPSIGVLALLAIYWFSQGRQLNIGLAVIGLVVYAVLPVMRNTMVGLQQVDPAVLEAGRGMGLSKRGVFFELELPLAVPVILAGIRTALIILVGTAALATYIGGGGLGDIIRSGLQTGRETVTYTGAVLVAVLALFIDYLAGIAEDFLKPKGL